MMTIMSAPPSTETDISAHPQGGIFEGLDPSAYNPADPVVLFIIQATLVMGLTRVLHWPLSKIREPQVIAEVLAGILLGPSVLGRIPGFTETIFPPESMPPFRLAANLGLILFLFLVGLETDLTYLLRNWRIATTVAAMSMAIPFGLGVAVAYGLYHEKTQLGLKPATFPVFALFVGVAMAITAFPVLCRILTSLKLLNTPVGVIVLTSGIANDVVGWILLALCVTLVNATSGLTSLWILLAAAGFALFLAYIVRPPFMWVLRRTRSLENGPTQGIVALTLFMVLASAFFTSIIGVHAIFGAFMVGLMCPHERGFAVKLTEKIEDLMSTLFIPLFFALSGLNTNLGLLNDGRTWAYVVAVTSVAFFSKIIGGMLGARFNGMVWRESITIGALMSCKGLVELIVLNIGLEANIISFKTFTIFVVMALVTTFTTAPLVAWLYPTSYQEKLELWKKGKINWDGTPIVPETGPDDAVDPGHLDQDVVTRMAVHLRADGISSLLSIIPLFSRVGGPTREDAPHRPSNDNESVQNQARSSTVDLQCQPSRPLRIHACHFRGLGERDSSWMKLSSPAEFSRRDLILKAFGASITSATRNTLVSGQATFIPEDSLAEALLGEASKQDPDLILVPWSDIGHLSDISSLYGSTMSKASPLANSDFLATLSRIFDAGRRVAAIGAYLDRSQFELGDHDGNSEKRPTWQLKRGVSGVSLSEDQEPGVVKFPSAGYRLAPCLRVLYSGSTDDFHAVRIAYQIARSHQVEVHVVELPSVSGPTISDFTRLKNKMQESLPAGRITFNEVVPAALDTANRSDDLTTGLQTLLHRQGSDSGPVLFLLGRSAGTGIEGSGKERASGSETAQSAAGLVDTLGSAAAGAIAGIQKWPGWDASVLVIQSKTTLG